MSPVWGVRKEEKTKKTQNEKATLCKTWFFRGLPIRASYVTRVGGKEGGKNEKTTLCKTWFFRGLPIRGSYVTPVGGKEGGKNEKTHFVKRGFFVVCPYWPLWHPCTHDCPHSSMRLRLKAC